MILGGETWLRGQQKYKIQYRQYKQTKTFITICLVVGNVLSSSWQFTSTTSSSCVIFNFNTLKQKFYEALTFISRGPLGLRGFRSIIQERSWFIGHSERVSAGRSSSWFPSASVGRVCCLQSECNLSRCLCALGGEELFQWPCRSGTERFKCIKKLDFCREHHIHSYQTEFVVFGSALKSGLWHLCLLSLLSPRPELTGLITVVTRLSFHLRGVLGLKIKRREDQTTFLWGNNMNLSLR